MDDEPKLRRRWGSTGYIALIVIALLFAVFVVRPIGQEIAGIFQRLTEAFKNGR